VRRILARHRKVNQDKTTTFRTAIDRHKQGVSINAF
jgi:hypothetical protein